MRSIELTKQPAPFSAGIQRRIFSPAQQCVNIKKDALQFVLNDREFKQTAIQWRYDKLKEKKGGADNKKSK